MITARLAVEDTEDHAATVGLTYPFGKSRACTALKRSSGLLCARGCVFLLCEEERDVLNGRDSSG
jgi:hypothetical protein